MMLHFDINKEVRERFEKVEKEENKNYYFKNQ